MNDIVSISIRKSHWGRGITDDDWERLDPAYIALWRDAQTTFFPRKLKVGDRSYIVTGDLQPAISSLSKTYNVMRRLYPEHGERDLQAAKDFPQGKDSLLFDVVQETGDHNLNVHVADNLIQSALFDLFLVMNISGPGSFDLYRAEIIRPDEMRASEISLSNHYFESAITNQSWPIISTMPFRQVTSWFDMVRSGTAQIAQNPTEKVLFALWHLAQAEVSPVAVIWIFYTLETLLCSQPGNSFSLLKRRLMIILRPSEHEAAVLNKKMRTLYDLRSSFVHGGSGMFHPMRNELLDQRADEQYAIYSDSIDFGILLIIKIIQIMIGLKISQLNFQETLDLLHE